MKLFIALAVSCLAFSASAQINKDEPVRDGPDQQKSTTPFQAVPVKADWNAVRAAEKEGEISSAETMQRSVSAKGDNERQLGRLLQQASQIDTPVLLPESFGLIEDAQFVTSGAHYSYTADLPGDEFYIVSGTCAGARLPEGHPILERMRENRPDYPTLSGLNVRYQLSKTEAGHQIKFSKFGCGYQVTYACPGECNEAGKVTAITQKMGVINAR